MTAPARALLVGSQDPTHLWHTPYEFTQGERAIELYEAAAGPLDLWQKHALRIAMATDPLGVWLAFEFALILSRQNGKGQVLIALELAWLLIFHDRLIIHTAHLFETCREHFLKIQAIIENNRWIEKRIETIREGRGSEEIVIKAGRNKAGEIIYPQARLKFMTRKGGAARGFTGSKLVCDEAMYLDATMMAAGVPTMATRRDAQIIYAASAGLPVSTQLALVRRRGLRKEKRLALMMWEAERAVYDERGRLIAGDDPADPRTHAKVNPAYNADRGPVSVFSGRLHGEF